MSDAAWARSEAENLGKGARCSAYIYEAAKKYIPLLAENKRLREALGEITSFNIE